MASPTAILALAALAFAACAGAPASAAPRPLVLSTTSPQQPDDGYGVSWNTRCGGGCRVTFRGGLEQGGRTLRGGGRFPPYVQQIAPEGNDSWFGWTLAERARLARAQREGPVTFVVRATAGGPAALAQ
jgi:hypothetical protein